MKHNQALKKYTTDLIDDFENPLRTPYDLNKEDFVKNFEFDYKILSKDIKYDLSIKDNNFIEKIEDFLFLHKLPVITLGNYGMGKSTIAKYLSLVAIEKDILPLFLELRNIDIKTINIKTKKKFFKSLFDTVFQNYKINKQELLELCEQKQIIIILDGIDEAIIKNNQILSGFIEFIISSQLPVYLSCRLEYANFIALYNSKVNYGNFVYKDHLNIILKDWGEKQWKTYESKLLSKNDLYKHTVDIKRLFTDIYKRKFGDIPKRPLFLKMLVRLLIENRKQSGYNKYEITEILSTNRSEIYHKYIKWQLFNDIFKHESNQYIDKKGALNTKAEHIIDTLFELLSHMAVREYAKTLQSEQSSIKLEDIYKIISKHGISTQYLTKKTLKNALNETSLFAILQREKNALAFAFSHKSFMEYLVAYRLASSIFRDDPKCDEVWGYYQTHEVSQHFMFEVQRVVATKWLEKYPNDTNLSLQELEIKTKNFRDDFLEKAFTDTLAHSLYEKKIDTLFYHYLDIDSEKLEEALFYIGRFRLKNNEEILRIFQNIFDSMLQNGTEYHPVYYRTVSLALAQMFGIKHCNKYVEFLLKDYQTTSQKHFKTNLEIQKNYYGEDSVMLSKLSNYIDQFLQNDTIQRELIPNDILTYFAIKTINEINFNQNDNYLRKIINKSKQLGDKQLLNICKDIQKLFIKV